MTLKKRYLLVILLVFSLTITGCYDVYINHQVNQDGSGNIIMILDFSKMNEASENDELGNPSGLVNESSLQDICDEFYEVGFGPDIKTQNLECIVEEPAIIITADFLPGSVDVNIQNDYLEYDLKNVNKFFQEIDESGETNPITDEELLEIEEEFSEFGTTFLYTVTFENEIIETQTAEFEGNTIEANIFTLAKLDEAIVKVKLKEETTPTSTLETDNTDTTSTASKETRNEINQELILMIGGAVLLLIILIIIIMKIKNKKKNINNYNEQQNTPQRQNAPRENMHNTQNPQENEKIQRIINWIRLYEKKYPEHILRENLEKNPTLTKDEINAAFKNK